MIFLKRGNLAILLLCLITIYITGCEFDDPYVPDSAGSSTLSGQIVTDPPMDLTGTEVLLRGQGYFATVTDADAKFRFRNIPPGDYSIHVEKEPYLQDDFSVHIQKSTEEDVGDVHFNLKGAIVGTIPNDKISIISGEVEITIYIDGVPLVLQPGDEDDFTIDLSSTESTISVKAVTRITVYIDNVSYPAVVQDDGNFIVEFVPPGIYNDIRVKVNSGENAIPVVSGGPVVIKSGQTRFLLPSP